MQVFGGLISPYVRKLCVVLEEMGVPYDLTQVSPHTGHAGFRPTSPFGKIPSLIDGDYVLSDSSAIIAYVEALYPERSVLPRDPRARGKAVWFEEFADTIFAVSGLKVLFNRFVGLKLLKLPVDEARALEGVAELPQSFAYVESVAPEHGWLLGEHFTLADIAVASVFRSLVYVGLGPDAQAYPRTAAWYARVAQRPSWQKVAEMEAYRPAKKR
jgi:glutathione S-transferase